MRIIRRDGFFKTALAGACLLAQGLGYAQSSDRDVPLTDLEDFVVYAEPEVMDALRKRPYSKKDPLVEALFQTLPSITNEVYQDNLTSMRAYLQRCKLDKNRKLGRLAELAGLQNTPAGMIEGYEDRIESLETILEWMKREKPIQLKRLNIWKESELRYRLARRPIENIRINPETNELETRLFFNWTMIFQNRPKARDLRLDFEMGIQLQQQTGYYNPRGFLHLSQFKRRDLNTFELSYPIILTQSLEKNLRAELPAYTKAYRATMDSFYQILREFFFSDLADIHALYILTRGQIFANEWKQYQSSSLQRGMAAYLVFQSFEENMGKAEVLKLQKNDWTTWHIRKIGTAFNSITWEGEKAPEVDFGAYKETLDMRNIYWSTRFVQFLVDKYGPSFVSDMCEAIKKTGGKAPPSDEAVFHGVTGANLKEVTHEFITQNSD
jgi:hypothetical protein